MNVAQSIPFNGQLLRDELMSKHTSWRVGGKADNYYIPTCLSDLQHYLLSVPVDADIHWIGLGSNLLVRDGGIRGHVIAPLNALKAITLNDDSTIEVEAGVTCARLAKFCVKNGFAGADFLAGIPGTVGGALAMNAGAFGSETWSFVEQLAMINRQGELITRQSAEFEIAYRQVSQFENEWFASARFRFTTQTAQPDSNIKQLLQQRNASQPIGLPSCGSVFKNPPGQHAAKLIEEAGLKGHCLGQACVSQKHANFIISNAQTRATDIEALIGFIQTSIQQKFGVALQTEVRILGDEL
ncbi:MAG: UDP-N-acetylmuramate dehydrogenase [Gammaproteobacteria bacterium]